MPDTDVASTISHSLGSLHVALMQHHLASARPSMGMLVSSYFPGWAISTNISFSDKGKTPLNATQISLLSHPYLLFDSSALSNPLFY
jgi:hypothetical protein